MKEFELLIHRHRDLLYGMALFFEGLAVLYLEQEQIIQTYRRQFRNLIRNNQEKLEQATALLDQAKQGAVSIEELQQFDFDIGEWYPDPEGLIQRAEILVRTYEDTFPGRDRGTPFTKEETLQLMEAAVARL